MWQVEETKHCHITKWAISQDKQRMSNGVGGDSLHDQAVQMESQSYSYNIKLSAQAMPCSMSRLPLIIPGNLVFIA